MSLTGIGDTLQTLQGWMARAESHSGETVTVHYSQEALDDFGSGVIWPIAEAKYSDGEFETDADAKVIQVTAADCQKWMDARA